MREFFQQLTSLVMLAGCAALAVQPKSRPANTGQVLFRIGTAENAPRRHRPSPEVQEFKKYPPLLQRQMLDYGRRYVNALFEAKNSPDS